MAAETVNPILKVLLHGRDLPKISKYLFLVVETGVQKGQIEISVTRMRTNCGFPKTGSNFHFYPLICDLFGSVVKFIEANLTLSTCLALQF